MPRKRLFAADHNPYHVTARSINKEWFELPMNHMWEIFSRHLYLMTLTFGIRIHAFVLMSNHFHLLISAPNDNLDAAMDYLCRQVSESIGHELGQAEKIFAGRLSPCFKTQIESRMYYEYAYKYVYRNPVEAKICLRVEHYPYSSLRGILGIEALRFPAFDNLGLITNPAAQLSWLNSPYPTADFLEDIRLAMRQPQFELRA